MEASALIPKELRQWINKGLIKGNTQTYSKQRHRDELSKRMSKIGYKMLGEGSYSGAFEHPVVKDKVIKVTLATKDGYHRYIEWVIMISKILPPKYRKHLPKIYHTETIKNCRITVLEKLSGDACILGSHYIRKEFLEYNALTKVLNEACLQFGLNNDIYNYNNILYRRRTPVVTDPWSHKK